MLLELNDIILSIGTVYFEWESIFETLFKIIRGLFLANKAGEHNTYIHIIVDKSIIVNIYLVILIDL